MSNLLLEAQSQDREANRTGVEIITEKRAVLVRYVGRFLADSDRAEDVVQDVFVKFLAQDPAELRGREVEWLFTACRHRALDLLRKEGRMETMTPEQANGIPDAEKPPGRALEEDEIAARLLQVIRTLRPNQQEVIRLKFDQGFSYKEIARITESSAGNVGFLIHTALVRLRREFRGPGLDSSPAGPE